MLNDMVTLNRQGWQRMMNTTSGIRGNNNLCRVFGNGGGFVVIECCTADTVAGGNGDIRKQKMIPS